MAGSTKQCSALPVQVSTQILDRETFDQRHSTTGRIEFTISEVAPSSKAKEIQERQQRAIERTASLMQSLLNLPTDELELIAEGLEHGLQPPRATEAEVALAKALAGGRQFSKWERLALEFSSLERYLEQKRVLLNGGLTAAQVAERLISLPGIINYLVEKGDLLAIAEQGELLFPACQFDPEAPNGIIAGLPEVLKALDVEPLSKLSWLVRPNPLLDSLTPIDALKQGQRERVLAEARGVGVV